MSLKKPSKLNCVVNSEPSHARFEDIITYSVRGHSQSIFPNCSADDHIAELFQLEHDDTDPFLWFGGPASRGVVMREMFNELTEQIGAANDLTAAKTLYALATHAAFEVLNLYLRNRDLFDQITPRRRLLPCLISIHPNTAKVVAEMERDSHLGQETEDASTIRSTASYVSDSPPNVYARAIINSIQMNRDRDSVEVQQASWLEYELQSGVRVEVQPLPKFIDGIDLLPFPMTPKSVLAYWRKGKEIILEEMPDFHLRPEWESYHRRRYQHGPKKGAVQHAIFKDILAALQTIVGNNKSREKPRLSEPRRSPK